MKRFPTHLFTLILSALTALAADSAELTTTLPVEGKANGEKWWRGNFERINADIKKMEGEIDVAFVGDSITARWKGDSWNKHWSASRAVNMGIGGDRTQNVLWRLHNGQLDMDISAKFLEPDGSISKEVMKDFLHLGSKGFDIWAEAIQEKVKELTGGAKSGQKTRAPQQ